MRNAIKRGAKIYQLSKTPVDFVANIFQILVPTASAFGLFWGYDDLSSTSKDATQLGFPLRFVIMTVCSGILGVGLGFGITFLTKQNSSVTRALAFILSFTWAGLLLVIVDALSLTSSNLPDFNIFLVVGMAFVMGILTFSFRAGGRATNIAIVEDRAGMIACFSITSLLFGLLVQIGRSLP